MAGRALLLQLMILEATRVSADELRIAFVPGTSSRNQDGRRAIDLWVAWANSGDNMLNFTVNLTVASLYTDASTAAIESADVVIAPYGSSSTRRLTQSEAMRNFRGPILMWGASLDYVYFTGCKWYNLPCFGTLLPQGDTYVSGLTALLALSAKPLAVVRIARWTSPYSYSCGSRLREHLRNTDGLTDTEILALYDDDDNLSEVPSAMESEPDIVVVCGPSSIVPRIIAKIAEGPHLPHAILAQNSITSDARPVYDELGDKSALMNCLLQPTRNDMYNMYNRSDPNVGWTSDTFAAAFAAAYGMDASIYAASAAASLIALTAAMADGGADNPDRIANLASLMRRVNTDSFYGRLSFKADGSLAQPSPVQQHQGEKGMPIFTDMFGGMKTDLQMCKGWGTPLNCNMVQRAYRKEHCCGAPSKEIAGFRMVRLE